MHTLLLNLVKDLSIADPQNTKHEFIISNSSIHAILSEKWNESRKNSVNCSMLLKFSSLFNHILRLQVEKNQKGYPTPAESFSAMTYS